MRKNTIKAGGKIPAHIAIIMDGNGRWAKKRLMPRSFGHKAGMERMVGLIEHAFEQGVQYVSLYALSTENLLRPKEELDGLYDLIRKYFLPYMRKICEKGGARIRILGDISLLPCDVQNILKQAQEETAGFSGKGVNIALAYGGRAELVRAARNAVCAYANEPQKLDENAFAKLLYTAELPELDLLIRTGGEIRLSNFLLWQAAYAELYFTKKLFPDFTNGDLEKALVWFGERTRRFGKTDEQLEEEV